MKQSERDIEQALKSAAGTKTRFFYEDDQEMMETGGDDLGNVLCRPLPWPSSSINRPLDKKLSLRDTGPNPSHFEYC